MKRALGLWLLLALLVAGCATRHPLAGRWKGKDPDGQEVVLFLRNSGEFEAISKGDRITGQWKLDEKADPQRIDLVFENRTITSIVKLSGEGLLIEPVGEDGKIPTQFSKNATFYERES